jgi:hypothetical protein
VANVCEVRVLDWPVWQGSQLKLMSLHERVGLEMSAAEWPLFGEVLSAQADAGVVLSRLGVQGGQFSKTPTAARAFDRMCGGEPVEQVLQGLACRKKAGPKSIAALESAAQAVASAYSYARTLRQFYANYADSAAAGVPAGACPQLLAD